MTANSGRQSVQGTSFFRRSMVVWVTMAMVASLALGKLGYIQLFEGRSTAQAAAASRTAHRVLPAERGRITDTNGLVLAQSVRRYNIIGDPLAASTFVPVPCTGRNADRCNEVKGSSVGATGAAAVARLLAPTLGMNAMELGAKLTGTGRYVVLKKNITPALKRTIDKLNLDGVVSFEETSQRTYPNGSLLGSLLGGVDSQDNGVAGIEKTQNAELDGTDGSVTYQQGRDGQEIPGTRTGTKDPVDGSDVQLTGDRDVDWYVKRTLANGKSKYHAAWAIGVVQEVGTGRIIAIEDTNNAVAGSTQAKLTPSQAVAQTFEPGSTGKVITLSGLLQAQIRSMDDHFSVPYSVVKGGQEFHDSHAHGTERWTLAGILKNSSNVGVVMASEGYSTQRRYDYLTKFGIGQPSGLQLPGESPGLLAAKATDWDQRTKDTVLFGQGYATNALQLTNVVATVANKGVRTQQSVIESVKDEHGATTDTKPTGRRVVDQQVAGQVLNAMESVAEQYKGIASVPGYRVAAKTGTAEVAGASGRLTSIVSDWVGVIPADNPRFVVTVVMKDATGTYGGLTAGPVFADIGEFLMQKYDVPTSAPRRDAIPVDW